MIVLVALSIALAVEGPRLMVMPPHAQNDDVAVIVQRDVERAARDLGRFRLVPGKARDALLARAAGAGITCDPRVPECALRVGVFGGVDFVLTSAIDEAVPPRARVALHDCTDGREVRAVVAPLASDDAARTAGLRLLVGAAAGDTAPLVGRLHVDHPADAPIPVDVEVDEAPRGRAPLELELTAGTHDVVLRPQRGEVQRARVVVPLAGRATIATAAAGPDAGPAGPSPGATGAAGAGGGPPLGLVAGGVVAGLGVVAAAAGGVGSFLVAPSPDDRAGRTAQEYNDAVMLGRVLLVVSAVGAVTALAGTGVALAFAVTGE